MKCPKCQTPLVESETEEGPATGGYTFERQVPATPFWGPYRVKESSSGARLKFVSHRCPTCRKTRAVETRAA